MASYFDVISVRPYQAAATFCKKCDSRAVMSASGKKAMPLTDTPKLSLPLASVFERAYVLHHEEHVSQKRRRRSGIQGHLACALCAGYS